MDRIIVSAALLALTAWIPVQAEPPLPVEAVGGVSLPGVPPSVAKAAVEAGSAARAAETQNDSALTSEPIETNVTLTVSPGVTDLVRIARNYLNRIVTPFEDPKVLSVNPIEVQKVGASLYLASGSERPVGIHILSNDPADTRSISLTLIPARIPPKTITLKWPDGIPEAAPASSPKARRWEESAPYEEKLFELVEHVARGEIPDGYSLTESSESPRCALRDVNFFAGQRLTGHHFSVFILRATNVGRQTLEILGHAGCDLPGVTLVAPWPSAYLEPGASTELYVVVANAAFEPHPRERLRPSLLVTGRNPS